VIGTKGGHPGAPGYRTTKHWLSPSRIEADIDDSLGSLGLDTIDLYWLHRDDTRLPVGEIVEMLNREIQRGRIRWLGASNWRPARIAEANSYATTHGLQGFSGSQPEFNLACKNTPNPDPATDSSHGDVMLFLEDDDQKWHEHTQIPVVAYSSNAGGYFAGGGTLAKNAYDNPVSRQRLLKTQTLAKELNVTSGQVALAWVMHQPFPVFPIVGSCDPGHLLENLEAATIRLTPEQVEQLAAP
jgi:aryl-alcohol dehydrogenase-like predicted oxidoreductase